MAFYDADSGQRLLRKLGSLERNDDDFYNDDNAAE